MTAFSDRTTPRPVGRPATPDVAEPPAGSMPGGMRAEFLDSLRPSPPGRGSSTPAGSAPAVPGGAPGTAGRGEPAGAPLPAPGEARAFAGRFGESAGQAWVGVWKAYADEERQRTLAGNAAIDANRADIGVTSAMAAMRNSGFGVAAPRGMNHAEHAGDLAEAAYRTGVGAAIGGPTAAMGMFVGTFGAGPLPKTMNGAAASGSLDTFNADGTPRERTSAAYHYANPNNPGGFMGVNGAVPRAGESLARDFGGNSVVGAFQQHGYAPFRGSGAGGASGADATARAAAGVTTPGGELDRPPLPRGGGNPFGNT